MPKKKPATGAPSPPTLSPEHAAVSENSAGTRSRADPATQENTASQLRDEEILTLLRQQQQQQHDAAVAAAAVLPPSVAATYLARAAQPFGFAPPPPPPPVETLLAAAAARQHPPPAASALSGISTATILELAHHRPDVLALLQPPPTIPPHSLIYAATAGGSNNSTATSTVPPSISTLQQQQQQQQQQHIQNLSLKRGRDGQEKSGSKQLQGGSEHDKQAAEDEDPRGTAAEDASGRPRKRVMFQLGELGSPATMDEETTEEGQEPWTTDLHRQFVEAIFSAGIKHASPSVLLDLMSNAHNFPLTSERVKSRLQKYRNHSDKSRSDFLQEYDTFLQRALSIGSQTPDPTLQPLLPMASVLQLMGIEEPLYGGDAAAAATYDILYKSGTKSQSGEKNEKDFDSTVHTFLTPKVLKQGSSALVQRCQGQSIEIPRLTAEEMASPLGASFNHVIRTFEALSNELDRQRADTLKQTPPKTAPAQLTAVSTNDKLDNKANIDTSPQAAPSDSKESSDAPRSSETKKAAVEHEGAPKDSTNTKDKDDIRALVSLMYQHEKGKKKPI